MITKKSISVIIPTYNEENELEGTIINIVKIVSDLFDDYELLIFDDCSTDKTGEILDKLAKRNDKIRVFHNKKNMNMGYNFRKGIQHATKKYVMLLQGPDSMVIDSVKDFMSHVGKADAIVSIVANKSARPLYRRIISYLVTKTLNMMFGLNRDYYFGLQAYESRLVKNIKMTTNSFGILPEILLQLIWKGYSVLEIPVHSKKTAETSTTAYRLRNVFGVIDVVSKLFFELRLGKKRICQSSLK